MDPLPQKNLYWMVKSRNWYFILFYFLLLVKEQGKVTKATNQLGITKLINSSQTKFSI